MTILSSWATTLAASVNRSERPLAGGERLSWVDIAKGIGITLVVYGHTVRGLWNSAVVAETPLTKGVDTWVYAFHMPLFFLLSGLFAMRQISQAWRSSITTKLKTIAYPYLIWATAQHLIQSAAGGAANNPVRAEEFWRVHYLPPMQFWFLYTLLLIALSHDLLLRAMKRAWVLLVAWVGLWGVYEAGVLPLGRWSVPHMAIQYFGYFALGAAAVEAIKSIDRAKNWTLGVAAVAGAAIVAFHVMRGQPGGDVARLAVALAGVAMALAAASMISRTPASDLVAGLGKASLAIFVAHTIVSAGVRIVLQKGFGVVQPWTHFTIGMAGGLVLPSLLWRTTLRVPVLGWLFRWR